MGRMLNAMGQGEMRRSTLPSAEAAPPEDAFSLTAEDGEVPFVEVGARNDMDGSPAVLALRSPRPQVETSPGAAPTPRLRLAPQPPGVAPVQFEPLAPASFPAPVAVSFQPLALRDVLPPPVQRFSGELIAFHQPEHAASEQYRQLAATLRRGARSGASHVVLFTSLAPRVGTTCVVLNLAITWARQGIRVGVVDANLRRSDVAGRLGLPDTCGLADVLAGRESLDEALQESGLNHLTVLTAGSPDAAWPIQTSGEACRPVLRLLRDRFDIVLIDAPPHEQGQLNHGLETAADAVYLVTSRTEVGTSALEEGIRQLTHRGVPIRGSIVTGH